MAGLATTTQTSEYDYDLFVIGCGSGGIRAGRIACTYGARVCIADDMAVGLGGTCVNVGCVPKKLMVYGSEYGHHWHEARGFGWDVPETRPALTWPRLIENKDSEIKRLNGIYKWLVENPGGELVQQRAALAGPHTVRLADGTTKTAGKILVAVGGWPTVPAVPGGGKEHIITSNEVFFLPQPPEKVVIWGAGYIAVEFAGIFKGYGSEVHLVLRKDKILTGFDDDTRSHLQQQMEEQGFHFHYLSNVQQVEKTGEGAFRVHLTPSKEGGPEASVIDCDLVMGATGRAPKVDGLGLEEVGVKVDARTKEIVVDANGQTSVPSIYSVGDCTSALKLTPVALEQGHAFADTFFGGKPREAELENVATAVFSNPNLGTVGLTEAQAVAKYGRVKVYTSSYTPLKGRVSGSTAKDFMKMLVDEASDRVVGIHMVGHGAGDIMQGFAVAIKCGATKAQVDLTVGIHPTAAEELVTMRTVKRVSVREDLKASGGESGEAKASMM
jgi:glutathione reductase (NADPH)